LPSLSSIGGVARTTSPAACTETVAPAAASEGCSQPWIRCPAGDRIGITESTGLSRILPDLPALTKDLQASKSIAKSASCPAGTVRLTFIFRPLCCALGVVSGTIDPPVGLIAFANGSAAVFSARTSRIWL
jgi:hypothetical protein